MTENNDTTTDLVTLDKSDITILATDLGWGVTPRPGSETPDGGTVTYTRGGAMIRTYYLNGALSYAKLYVPTITPIHMRYVGDTKDFNTVWRWLASDHHTVAWTVVCVDPEDEDYVSKVVGVYTTAEKAEEARAIFVDQVGLEATVQSVNVDGEPEC